MKRMAVCNLERLKPEDIFSAKSQFVDRIDITVKPIKINSMTLKFSNNGAPKFLTPLIVTIKVAMKVKDGMKRAIIFNI